MNNPDSSITSRKLFIGGLSSSTTQESLSSYFEQFGGVQDAILMVDRVSGRSRCFGFVTMQDASSLTSIISQSHTLDGKKVDCKRAVPKETHTQSYIDPYFKTKKMFVGGLPPDVTGEAFKMFFEQFGEVEDSVVILDKETGRPRGFGFVTFASDETADRVLENYEKNCINGKWVECKKATPKQSFVNSQFQGFQAFQGFEAPGFNPFFQSGYLNNWYLDYGVNEFGK